MQLLNELGLFNPTRPKLLDPREIREQEDLDTKTRQNQRDVATRRLDSDRAAAEVEYEGWAGKKPR